MNTPQQRRLTEVSIVKVLENAKKIGFDINYNLIDFLNRLPIILDIFKNGNQFFFLRKSKLKKEIQSKLKILKKLKNQTKNDSPVTKELLQASYRQKNNISPFENSIFNIYQFEKLVEDLYDACCFSLNELANIETPIDKGGVKPHSISKAAIFHLSQAYKEGTGKDPKCDYYRSEDEYVGEFYEWICFLKSILLSDLDIDLLPEPTIGQYAVENF